MRRSRLLSIVSLSWILSLPSAFAGSHHEITAIPLGHSDVTKEKPDPKDSKARVPNLDYSWRLPGGPQGTLPQPVVLIATQPWTGIASPAEGPPTESELPQGAPGASAQVPATLKISIGGKNLPDWVLTEKYSIYVLSRRTLEANPEFKQGRVALRIEIQSDADGVRIMKSGLPDVLLAGEETDGPLADSLPKVKDPEVKEYLGALLIEFNGDNQNARPVYEKLAASANAELARFVRRRLRQISHLERSETGNFDRLFNRALYLRQCGLFSAAYNAWYSCVALRQTDPLSNFYEGEMFDRIDGNPIPVVNRMYDAGMGSSINDPNRYFVLVTVLKNREGRTLLPVEIEAIRNQWRVVEVMVYAATGGALKIETRIHLVSNEEELAYVNHQGLIVGPPDDFIQRGWFDGVISIRPRLAAESGSKGATVGGDVGPSGAALSALYHDETWQDMFQALYEQFLWSVEVNEIEGRLPSLASTVSCGHQPIPNRAYGYRAALHYHATPAICRKLKIADEPVDGAYVRLWRLEGPFPVKDAPPADGLPGRHVLDPLPAATPEQTLTIESSKDFVRLDRRFPKAGWALARATAWVYSPDDQYVRMWLGQNDGLAVWVNGELAHEGRYYSQQKYADKDLVDVVASSAMLRRGWNEVVCVVESWPAPFDKGWGFSLRFSTWDNKAIPGLSSSYSPPPEDRRAALPQRPSPGGRYNWAEVRHDFHNLLPRLDAPALRKLTGVKDLTLSGEASDAGGHVALIVPDRKDSAGYRALGRWDVAKDRDVVLNNVQDLSREDCLAFRYARGNQAQDLLLLKPEALHAYLTLLIEPDAAKQLFSGKSPAERILGYVALPEGPSYRCLIAVDALLGDDKSGWPGKLLDEEDLLQPDKMPPLEPEAVTAG